METFGGFHREALNEFFMHRQSCAVTHRLNLIAFIFAECFSYHHGPISDLCKFIKTTRGGAGGRYCMPQALA